MANIRKSFNFRNGVQVDNDNFIVNANGLVGIGTSIPTESLDLIGNAKISGFTTTTTLGVAQTSNFYGDIKVGPVNIDPNSGVITATKFVGDASGLQNIFAISTTGWVAGVGLHTFRAIGIGTDNPEYNLQIEENPATGIGIGMTNGNIIVSGNVTAAGNFIGSVTGDVLGDVTGNLTGVAASATKLETTTTFEITGDVVSNVSQSYDGTSNINLVTTLSSSFDANTTGKIIANSLESTFLSVGTGTITNATLTDADIENVTVTGIGSFNDIRIDRPTPANLIITSEDDSSISIGKSVGAGNSSAQLLYSPATGRLDINNYDTGGVRINLHEGTGVGNTESFDIQYKNSRQFEVTYDGKVGINRSGAILENNLEVGGDALITGNGKVVGILTVTGTAGNTVTLGDGSTLPVSDSQNFNTLSGISTFNDLSINNLQVGAGKSVVIGLTGAGGGDSDLFVLGNVGIGTTSKDNFVDADGEPPTVQINGSAYITAGSGEDNSGGLLTKNYLGITTKTDGKLQSDPRDIPSDLGSTVPSLSYGNFQVDTGAASLIVDNLLIIPNLGKTAVGFGSTNLGMVPTNHDTDKYLTNVGVNTYFARSLFDVGAASTTMNSYFIPPSLTEDEISTVSNLWQSTTDTGRVQANKVTPNGLIPGGLVYNSSRDTIQVRNTASSFRNLSPVVAFATVDGGNLVAADTFNLVVSNDGFVATFTFDAELSSGNYTVIVSNQGTSTFTVADKVTNSFKITFSSGAGSESYSVMILQV
jgi:hypothetical protein